MSKELVGLCVCIYIVFGGLFGSVVAGILSPNDNEITESDYNFCFYAGLFWPMIPVVLAGIGLLKLGFWVGQKMRRWGF